MKVAGDKQGTVAGALAALVAAGVGLATAFGVHVTGQEHAAILTFCAAVAVAAPLVGSIFDHANKTSVPAAVAQHLAAPATPSQAEQLQSQIDNLQAQKDALGGSSS